MAAAQADEVLVEAQHPGPLWRELGRRGRQGGADLVVAAEGLGLHPAEGLLVPVVDAGHAAHGHEQDDGERRPAGPDLAGDAGDVVVADEGRRDEPVQQLVVALEAPVELVEVDVGQRAPGRLPQLVLGDGVHGGGLDEAGVVAVDDLTHEPGVGVALAHGGQDARPEGGVDGVGGVQAPGARAAVEPVGEYPHGQVAHLGGVVVEGGQGLVPLEGGVAGAGRSGIVPDGAVPDGGVVEAEEAALLSPGAGGPEQGVLGADVPEDTVEHEGQAPGAAGLGKAVEGGVITQAGVDAQVVGGVVAVGGGGEDRPERQTVGTELDGVVEPGLQAVQARGDAGLGQGRTRFGADGCAGGAEGVDLPPDGVVDPGGGCGTAYSR